MSDLVDRLREGTTIRLSETASTYTPPPKLQAEAADRIEALERERDAMRARFDKHGDYTIQLQRIIEAICYGRDLRPDSAELHHHKMAARYIAASQSEASRLRDALTPFAEYMGDMDRDNLGNPLPDDAGVGWVYLTQGDFRRARAALEKP